ncbi:hypothetical protein ANN_25143 [Periplaneta americana]|uniref:Uncharacterized protein n=1 Tax=Periplaneta americana TaxID=6978 RepID=A0ABQ8S0T5_PERAM|nr:hypothetical protein ANN_25143 [Periplaneta americana]
MTENRSKHVNKELAEVHFMYGKTDGNAALARRLHQERCPNRWIGRGGPIAWPPRSPDFNPIDFYLWGHLKSLLYSSPAPDMESLRNRIVAGCEEIRNTPGIWDRVRRAMRHRCEACIQSEGGHFSRKKNVPATKGNIESGEFGPVLWIEFSVAQWSERLVREPRTRAEATELEDLSSSAVDLSWGPEFEVQWTELRSLLFTCPMVQRIGQAWYKFTKEFSLNAYIDSDQEAHRLLPANQPFAYA